jgi:hypothetical protein
MTTVIKFQRRSLVFDVDCYCGKLS